MENIRLDQWKVMASLPYQADFSSYIKEGRLINPATNLVPWIDACVPGSIYRDLIRAGLIEDPYFDINSLHCEWVAGRWWTYRTAFTVSKAQMNKTLLLRFAGIDYSAKIYVNGKKVGSHEGMYIPFEAVINDYVKPDEENILVCVLEHAPIADPQPGYTSKTRYLKARFNYKWDFAARVVDLGLYGPVTLTAYDACSVSHTFVRPVLENDRWKVVCQAEIDAYCDTDAVISFDIDLNTEKGVVPIHAEKAVSLKKGYNAFEEAISLGQNEPLLWWPNGYGCQVLSQVRISVLLGGACDDCAAHHIGFRTLEFIHADGREDALKYCAVVNKKRIYLKGTNMVPLDCMHLTDETEIDRRLRDVKDANVNFLRIWGGGHIESEAFYRAADKYGLMVLQEFPMSSSGCDDVPSENPEFLKLLSAAAIYNVKRLRNHVSLIFMDGGNELTDRRYLGRADHEGHPADFTDPTLAMLKGIVNAFAPDVQMLPSSASGPNALLKVGDIGNNHDVHGPWGYMGVYRHYEFYDNSDSIIHGEFGCGGIAGMEQIGRIFKDEDRKLYTINENRAWAHHTGGWDSYMMRERIMFGELREITLSDYVKVNQFVQAESLRYSLEANRRRQWKNVGQMTWQFNEPWPNVQCSNVLEYYGGKKLAYYAVREAYESVLASLKYKKLFYEPNETYQAEIYLINDQKDADYTIDYAVIAEDGRELCKGHLDGCAKEDVSFRAGEICIQLPSGLTGSFSVILNTACGSFRNTKEYLMLIQDKDLPLEMPDDDKTKAEDIVKRLGYNPFTVKRADAQSVIKYVDRVRRVLSGRQ
ncbi:MAG: hypothetical protein IJD86_00645 [Clostridia bacterium]|nr:hypothetical protein [Clostridia bacterium]